MRRLYNITAGVLMSVASVLSYGCATADSSEGSVKKLTYKELREKRRQWREDLRKEDIEKYMKLKNGSQSTAFGTIPF